MATECILNEKASLNEDWVGLMGKELFLCLFGIMCGTFFKSLISNLILSKPVGLCKAKRSDQKSLPKKPYYFPC